MSDLTQDLVRRFGFNLTLLDTLRDGMDDAAWQATAGAGGNTAHWILGHVVASRRNLLRMLDVELPSEPWEVVFGRAAAPGDTSDFPAVESFVAQLADLQQQLAARLGDLPSEVAERALPRPFPDGTDTVLGAASFLNFHEVYHLGQIGLVRRQVGLPGFA